MERPTPDNPESEPTDPKWAEFELASAYRGTLINSPFADDEERAEANRFDAWIETLPANDLELAKYAFYSLATSSSPELRSIAAIRIDILYHVDKEAALPLWRQLIEDHDEGVSNATSYNIELEAGEGRLSEEEAAPLLALIAEVRDRRFLRSTGIDPT